MANFTLTGVNISRIPENGGYQLQVQGTFVLTDSYEVHLGKNSTVADSKCYSGKASQGYLIYPWTSGILRCYSPLLAPGIDVFVTVRDTIADDVLSLASPIAVDYAIYHSTIFGLRKVFPPFYKTGPRNIEQVGR